MFSAAQHQKGAYQRDSCLLQKGQDKQGFSCIGKTAMVIIGLILSKPINPWSSQIYKK